ncbi:MAG: glycosidase, partial [Syntrophomonadaceae bacterium]|nr:glycosidase [Syntrophomonadaceae bacterium]
MRFEQAEFEQAGKGESHFDQSLQESLKKLETLYDIDLVIGIPFYNEKDTLPVILETIEDSLAYIKDYKKPLILCVGDPKGAEVIEIIQQMDLNYPHYEFLMKPGSNGRGCSIRAILEIANFLTADAVIFAADVVPEKDRGLKPEWIKKTVEPLGLEYDFVLTTYRHHYFEDIVTSFLVAPLLEQFYGCKIEGAISGIYALSHDLIEDLCREFKFWPGITRGYGIDPWLVTRVMIWGKEMCEVPLGTKSERISLEKVNYVFKEIARSLFECIKRDEEHWLGRRVISKVPDLYGDEYEDKPVEVKFSSQEMILFFKRNFSQYQAIYEMALGEDVYGDIRNIVLASSDEFRFEAGNWAKTVLSFLFEYWFSDVLNQDDILNALTSTFNGRIASYIMRIQFLQEQLENLKISDASRLIENEAYSIKEEQKKCFIRLRDRFVDKWKKKLLEITPPLTPAHYLEFVPGIPVVLPKKIAGKDGKEVYTEEVFNSLQKRYQEKFEDIIHNYLGVPEDAEPEVIISHVKDFMKKLEKMLDSLFPGNLYSESGVQQVLERLFALLPHPKMFSVKDEIFKEMVRRFPPVNVMIPIGCQSPRELIDKMDVRDAVSLANLIETRKYADRTLLWILENLRPEGMGEVDIKYIVLEPKLYQIARLGNISNLNKITTRIVTTPLNKGMGGKFPKLRFCLFVARHIMIAENYARLWKNFARERKNLGTKI